VSSTPSRAALYLRQSLDRNDTELAIDRQRDECGKYAARRGWGIAREYVDNSVSASKGRRPSYQRLLADIEAGEVDGVIAWDLDRLHRQPIELEGFIDLADRRSIALATVSGDVDLSAESGRMMARVMGAVARYEIEHKSKRQKAAGVQSASMGRPPQGRRAFGFRPDGLSPVPDEAAMIRKAYADLLAGESLRGIALGWNAAGSRTDKGNPWRPDSVRDCLMRGRNAGLREYHGEVVATGQWEAIVSEDTWRGAVALLTDPARRTTPDTRRKYLLSGLARCGICGARMDTGRTQRVRRTYKCSQSRHLAVAAEPIDDRVLDVIETRLSRADAAALLLAPSTGPDTEALRVEAVALTARLDELAELFAAGTITGSQLATGTETLRRKLDAARAAMADTTRVDVLGDVVGADDVRAAIESLSLDRRRAIVDMMLTVTLHSPGRGARSFRLNTVEPTWKV
jgi:site-specific DNA recombinase